MTAVVIQNPRRLGYIKRDKKRYTILRERRRYPALWAKAGAVPSLDLRFADNKSLTDAVTGASLVTFTRASNGTFTNSAGVLQTAATDVPRFDHNPVTGESLGLLVEEQRTNSIRNNTMVGAVAGTPGTLPTNWFTTGVSGLTRTVVGTGVVNGIDYIDVRISGTSTGTITVLALDTATATAASNSQAWAISSWMSIVGGSTANISNLSLIINQFSSNVFLSSLIGPNISSTISSSLVRQAFASTTNNAAITAVQPVIVLNYATATAIDITLRIGLPQLEQGAFATSPILTSTAAATRSADVASITGSAFSGWYSQSEGTVFASFINQATTAGTIVSFDDGTANNRWQTRYTPTTGRLRFVSTGSNIDQGTAASYSRGVPTQIATSAISGNQAVVLNGTPAIITTAAAMPLVDRAQIGNGAASDAAGALHIRRLSFWPTRLGNQVLQAITQ